MLNCYSILQTHEFMIVVLITYTPAHIQYTVYNTLKLQFNIPHVNCTMSLLHIYLLFRLYYKLHGSTHI